MRVYLSPVMLLLLMLGFASGLPLALTASTMSAWLKESAIDITTIGLFAAVAMPYSLKFLWAPLIDAGRIPFFSKMFGRRRGWMLVIQIGLFAAVVMMAFVNPASDPWLLAGAALLVSTLSASQDVVLDAYRVERVKPEQLGHATAMFTLGYRIGMLVSGAGALYLAEYYDWHHTYVLMGLLMVLGICVTLLCKEPEASEKAAAPAHEWGKWFKDSVVAPFLDLVKGDGAWLILVFIATYKLGDAFLGVMTNPFLLEIGFTKPEIASIVKVYGFAATIIGTFTAGWLVERYGMVWLLFSCGLLHALTNLMFLAQAHVGHDLHLLAVGIALENFTGGISSAVLVVFISRLCKVEFTATQYALLSSLATLGRTTLSSSSGWFVARLGWEGFFIFSVLLAVPSLILLRWLPRKI